MRSKDYTETLTEPGLPEALMEKRNVVETGRTPSVPNGLPDDWDKEAVAEFTSEYQCTPRPADKPRKAPIYHDKPRKAHR